MNVSDCYSESSQSMDEALSGCQWDIHWGQSSGGALGSPQSPEAKQKIMLLACEGDLNCAWRDGEIEELTKSASVCRQE